mmetsp:Transcript_6765/g.17240  ORF Transcript_6765/g.17240 Transcript_6765/m.17240 type:complete len:103 (+) Transcript_6765:96-404(+)
MKYVSTYLMLVMGGNDSPSAADVTAALEKVGVDVDAADLKRFLAGVEGKDLAEIMAAGKEKLAKFGGGGGGGGGCGFAALKHCWLYGQPQNCRGACSTRAVA